MHTPTKKIEPSEAVVAFWDDMKTSLASNTTKRGLRIDEALATASKFVGLLLACQDQRIDKEHHISVVMTNIEAGNQEFVEQVLGNTMGRG